MNEDNDLTVEHLRALVRSTKAASGALQQMGEALRDVHIEATAAANRRRLGKDAPPRSWELERHAFLARHLRRLD
jgi:hypothetical protein